MSFNLILSGFIGGFVGVLVADVLFGLVNFLLKRKMLKKVKQIQSNNTNVKKITYKG